MNVLSVAEPTPMCGRTAPPTLADLILIRLLAGGTKAIEKKKVLTDLSKLFHEFPSEREFETQLEIATEQGFVKRNQRSLKLQNSGRVKALEALGNCALPSKVTWTTIQNRILAPLALGVDPSDKAEVECIAGAQNKAIPWFVRRELKLPGGVGEFIREILTAVICNGLGSRSSKAWRELYAKIPCDVFSWKDRKVNPNELRIAAIRGWLSGGIVTPSFTKAKTPAGSQEVWPRPFDLAEFASTVYAAAKACPTGRFGDHKVFISHVWLQLKDEPMFRAFDLPTFKQRLLEANAKGLLTLTRADLPQVLDIVDVRESEITYLNASFHFVHLDKEGLR
jgi:hypothetical protein